MAKELKNNIRSFRYSDRVAEILDSMDGKSLNEKFENLVFTCYDALPRIQRDLDFYHQEVQDARNEYWKLIRNKNSLLSSLRLIGELEAFLKECNTIIPAAPDDAAAVPDENVLQEAEA